MERAAIVERIKVFRPAFCPWPGCAEHPRRIGTFHFFPHGSYRRADGSIIPRFRCGACRRTFSQQSFAFSYYLKRPELSVPIAKGLVAGSAHRQIARSLGCHHATVTRRAQRLGRHTHLLHHLALQAVTLREPVIVDDFDTYAGSQYFPCTLPTATGSESWFVYGSSFARERRRGHMSPVQKRRRQELERRHGRPETGMVTRAFRTLLDALPVATGTALRLVADDDPAIRRAVQASRNIHLETHANPARGPKGSARSPEARRRDEAMFANDQLHRFLRHSEAAHRRETIAFGRSFNGLVERLALFRVWRNLVQARSERRPRDGTPAMRVGLTDTKWTWQNVVAERLFPARARVGDEMMRLYRRLLVTPLLKSERRHVLKHAF
jgi:transposase-like protein